MLGLGSGGEYPRIGHAGPRDVVNEQFLVEALFSSWVWTMLCIDRSYYSKVGLVDA